MLKYNLDIDYLDKIPVYAIFVLMLIISANFLKELFPCKFQHSLEHNIYLKHFFGFLTLLFFVVLTAPLEEKPFDNIFIKSVGIYIWFVLFIRTTYPIFITLFIIFIIMYIVVLKKTYYKELFSKEDNKKEDDKKTQEKDLNMYDSINHYLLIFAAILTLVGFLIYLGEIKYTYRKKKKFTFLEFLHFILGKPPCEYEPEIITPLKALKYAIFEKS
jgi:hypothetical protein